MASPEEVDSAVAEQLRMAQTMLTRAFEERSATTRTLPVTVKVL